MRYNQVVQEKLTRKQVEFVLRRAAELDSGQQDAAAAEGDPLTVQDLMRLGDEAGLGSDSLTRALGEMRRGIHLNSEDGEHGALTRTVGPSRIIISREVPGPVGPVRRAVERFLRGQLMMVRRDHGDRVEWERAHGIWPGLVRSLDFSRRYALGQATRVETIVTAESAGTTSVTFAVDLSEMRRERVARMSVRSAVLFALVGLGGAAVLPGFGVYDLLALSGGGLLAGGVMAIERRKYLESRGRVALAPERFLDLLVQRRRRDADPEEDGQRSEIELGQNPARVGGCDRDDT